jgi:hypothetical protein
VKNAIFWHDACKNWHFGGTYCLHYQGGKNWRARNNVSSNQLATSQNRAFFIASAMKTSTLIHHVSVTTKLLHSDIDSSWDLHLLIRVIIADLVILIYGYISHVQSNLLIEQIWSLCFSDWRQCLGSWRHLQKHFPVLPVLRIIHPMFVRKYSKQRHYSVLDTTGPSVSQTDSQVTY